MKTQRKIINFRAEGWLRQVQEEKPQVPFCQTCLIFHEMKVFRS